MPDNHPSDAATAGPATPVPLEQSLPRKRLLRANTAVAIVIGTVLLLALTATWQSRRATQLRTVAERNLARARLAEDQAQQDLWRALLAEARFMRRSPAISRRETALETIRRAAALSPSPELRDEAIATLALPDYQLLSAVPLDPAIRSQSFDHQLRTCALGLTNGAVVIRLLHDGSELRRWRHAEAGVPSAQGNPISMEFSPTGDAIAVRYERGALAVLDVANGTARFARDIDEPRRPASQAKFSSDSEYIVTPTFTPDGFAVLEARTGTLVAHFPQISSYHHAAVRPQFHQFAAHAGGRVHLFDWDTRAEVAVYPFPEGARCLDWSSDGRKLAIGGNSTRVHVQDLVSNELLELAGHKDDVFDLEFDPAGGRLATSCLDNTLRIWDLRDGQLVGTASDRRLARWARDGLSGWVAPKKSLEVRREAAHPAFTSLSGLSDQTDAATMDLSHDGEWALTKAGPDSLLVWDLLEPGTPRTIGLTNVQSLCFHPTEPFVFLVRQRAVELRPWSIRTNQAGRTFELGAPQTPPQALATSADLVTASADAQTLAFVVLSQGEVWIQSLRSNTPPVLAEGIRHSSVNNRSGSVHGTATIALSPDGRQLVVGADGTWGIYLFDALTGRPDRKIDDGFGSVQFSPDGRWLVLVTWSYTRVFRTSDWTLAWTQPADVHHPSYAGAAAFSPDSARVALVNSAHRATLFETATGRELGTLEAPDGSAITLARWSGNGDRFVLATRDNRLNIWRPGALRDELAALGIDFAPLAAPPNPTRRPPRISPVSDTTPWTNPALFAGAGVAAAIALVFLRQHRRLISEFSQAEALALRREKELQVERELGELKNRFVSMVSHEFRTPLGISMSAVGLLRRYADRLGDDKRRELIEDIESSTKQMADLMEQVLVLGRVNSGRPSYRPQPIDLPGLCEKFVDESLSATSHRCPISLTLTDTLQAATAPATSSPESGVMARGDEGLLRHIVANLLSNAVKYSPAGSSVEFRVRRDGRNAVFTVSDRGIGIPSSDLSRLFEAFHRGDNVGETPGTGLGLAIVKRCVDLHAGRIDVDSAPGAGTTFTVTLPLFDLEPPPAPSPDA